MSPSTSYPPEISEGEGQRLAEVIRDWSLAHGLTVRPPPALVAADADPGNLLAAPVPVTLFPSPFPRVCYQQGMIVQKTYNELYAAISQDEEFLARIVKEIGDSDEFTQNLWKVHLRVKEEGYVQPMSLGLFRSDYMVHQEKPDSAPQIKQVEFNTIAASFGGLSSQTSHLHKFLASTEYPLLSPAIQKGHLVLPDNYSTKGLALGIQHAFDAYGESVTGHPKCVLLVVQDGERNVFDQKHLEFEISAPPAATPAFRVPFSALLRQTRLADAGSTKGRQLLYTPPTLTHLTFEVAVAYLRCAYGPGDYPAGSDAWDARYHLERSAAIKCPSVLTQVAGTKKVQQVLATPSNPADPAAPSSTADNILHRFLHPAAHAAALPQLERTFTSIYPLDGASAAGRRARELARDPARCVDYVLKPQREGGGNNVYGAAIPAYLAALPEAHWDAHVLMELIRPPAVRNAILRMGALERGGVICELGVFGACMWDASKGASAGSGGNIIYNETPGYLLRTKGDQSEEGGVAAGFGCMDSVTLVGEGGGPGSGERHEYIAKAL